MGALSLRSLRRTVAAVVASVLVVLFGASAAHAESTYALLCGKSDWNGSWSTWPTGGYTGAPCAAQIDYATTPLNGAWETYDFYLLSAGNYRVDVWVPCEHANAVMDWETRTFGFYTQYYDVAINQADLCGWYTVTPVFWNKPSASGILTISAKAWSGMVTPGFWVGTDAVRVVRV